MKSDNIAFCKRRMDEEDQLGRDAPSSEAAEVHYQLSMLYRIQLAVMTRNWRRD
jgi:hypothetical protein